MNDLVEHLGIGRASPYATFGSKHDLYLKALDRYVQITDAHVVDALPQPGPVLPAMRKFVLCYVNDIVLDVLRRGGCLVVNAATELLPEGISVAQRIGRSWDTLEVSLAMALRRAKAQDELCADLDTRALAGFCWSCCRGCGCSGRDPLHRIDCAMPPTKR